MRGGCPQRSKSFHSVILQSLPGEHQCLSDHWEIGLSQNGTPTLTPTSGPSSYFHVLQALPVFRAEQGPRNPKDGQGLLLTRCGRILGSPRGLCSCWLSLSLGCGHFSEYIRSHFTAPGLKPQTDSLRSPHCSISTADQSSSPHFIAGSIVTLALFFNKLSQDIWPQQGR